MMLNNPRQIRHKILTLRFVYHILYWLQYADAVDFALGAGTMPVDT